MKNISYRAFDYKHKGTHHAYNQDFTSVRSMKDGSVIAAIADGCSSEILSGVGGYFLCDSITGSLCEKFNPLFSGTSSGRYRKSKLCRLTGEEVKGMIDTLVSDKLSYLCDGFRYALRRSYPILEDLEVPAHLFACTLIVVIALSDGTTYIYHIGDGVVLGRRADKTVEVLSEPKNIGSQCRTYFASDYDFASNVVFTECKGGGYNDYFMTTDGWDKALTNGEDTSSNLKALLTSLVEYKCTCREDFTNALEEARENLKSFSLSRVDDDMSCVWITREHNHVILNNDGDVSVAVMSTNPDKYMVRKADFGKTKVVIRIKKVKEKNVKPAKGVVSFISDKTKKCKSQPSCGKRDNKPSHVKGGIHEKTIVAVKKEPEP